MKLNAAKPIARCFFDVRTKSISLMVLIPGFSIGKELPCESASNVTYKITPFNYVEILRFKVGFRKRRKGNQRKTKSVKLVNILSYRVTKMFLCGKGKTCLKKTQ